MEESESDSSLLRPKAPESSVVLWSPRHQHLSHPAMTDFLVRSTHWLFVDNNHHLSVLDLFSINWCGNKSVSLSLLNWWAKEGWVFGAIGDPSNFLPNSREVSLKLGGLDVSALGSRAQLSVLVPLVSNANESLSLSSIKAKVLRASQIKQANAKF